MEHLEPHLGKDVSLLIFEYLINDRNYTPFRYEDIVLLDKKITRFRSLLLWAVENGHLDVVKHISPHIKDKDDWITCAIEAASKGHAPIFFYIMNKYNCVTCRVMEYAGVGGNLEIINFIRNNCDDADEHLIIGASMVDNLELFIECIPSLENNIDIWQDGIRSIVFTITSHKSMGILKYVGEYIDGVILDVDWIEVMDTSSYGGNLDMFRYSLYKGADITEVNDCSIGAGGNMKIVKHVENAKSIDWDKVILDAVENGHNDLVLYAFNKSISNWKECMIEASKEGYLDILLLLEREVKEYISTAVWNKCMTSATRNPEDEVMDIIDYCRTKGAYDWNECLREGARNLHFDIIAYAESMGADDFQESLIRMKRPHFSPNGYDIQTTKDYEREKQKMICSVKEYLENKLRMCNRRLSNRRIAEVLGWEKSI
uniref:Ankyrin repeat protein n=1 Tax=Pithovirus LCPAC401 TaxID=2506595 RepID=A0A481ZCQ9_9VIRU|nr:MAG: ankyrin repeat protein [Pithovirus LCPAC401]